MNIILLIAAIVNSSLSGGNPEEFVELMSPYDMGRLSDEVGPADTPGSTNWYSRVDTFRVPADWIVYTNGVIITNEASKPRLEVMPLNRDDYGFLNLTTVMEGDRKIYRHNQFEVQNGEKLARAIAWTDFNCCSEYGFPLYWMNAHKLDKNLYSSFFSSYNAYWERLYYASLCPNAYISEDDTPEAISLDPKWHFVRATCAPDDPYSRKLFEYAVITDFVSRVCGDLRNSLHKVMPQESPGSEAKDSKGHPAFIWREGWLTDGYYGIYGGNDSKIWWASTRLPPFRVQHGGLMGSSHDYTPTEDDLSGQLMPYFDWREDGISHMTEDADQVMSSHWQCYAVTLSSVTGGGGGHPILDLFERVGISSKCGTTALLRTYDCGGPLEFFTNAYSFAGRECPNANLSLMMYAMCFGPDAQSRKILPGAFVGANHLLGVMDRIIYMPTQVFGAINDTYEHRDEAEYTMDEELEIEVEWNKETQRFELKSEEEDRRFRATTESTFSTSTSIGSSAGDKMVIEVNPVSVSDPEDVSSVGDLAGVLFFGEGDADAIFQAHTNADFFDITGFKGSGSSFINVEYYITQDHSGSPLKKTIDFNPDEETVLRITPTFKIHGSYDVTVPSDTIYDFCQKHAPDENTSDRVSECTVAFLDRRDVSYDYIGLEKTEYKSDGDQAVNSDAQSEIQSHYAELSVDEIEYAKSIVGNFDNPPSFVNLPYELDGTIHLASAYVVGGVKAGGAGDVEHDFEYKVYDVTLDYEDYAWVDVTNDIQEVDSWLHNGWFEVHELWRQRDDSSWYLYSSVTNYSGETSEHLDYWAETNSSPPVVIFSQTNSYDFSFNEYELESSVTMSRECDTNVVDDVSNFYEEYDYSVYEIYSTYEDPDGSEDTYYYLWEEPEGVTTNEYHYSNEETQHYSFTEELTYAQILERTTNYIETTEIVTCPAYYRVRKDYSWEKRFTNPLTLEEVVAQTGNLPLHAGLYTCSVVAEDEDLITIDTVIPSFGSHYLETIKFSILEMTDFKWKSVIRIDIDE